MANRDREVGLGKLKFAEEVGISFVRQYYHCVASEGLENLEAFYAKDSIFSFNGSIVGVGPEEIKKQYKKLGFQEAVFDLESGTFDFAPSHDDGIIIIVSGSLIPGSSTESKQFTQTFFLAPQGEKKNGQASSFFVLNDIVRHSSIEKCDDAQPVAMANGATAMSQTPVKESVEVEVEAKAEAEVEADASTAAKDEDSTEADLDTPAGNETVEKAKPKQKHRQKQKPKPNRTPNAPSGKAEGGVHAKPVAEADASVAEEEVPDIAEAQVEKSEVQQAGARAADTNAKTCVPNNGPNRGSRYNKEREKASRQTNATPNHGQTQGQRNTKGESSGKSSASASRSARNHNNANAGGSTGAGEASEKKGKAVPSSWASIVSSKKDAKAQCGSDSGSQGQENNVDKKKQNAAQGTQNNNKFKSGSRPSFARTSTSVFVKDLDKSVNDKILRELFEPHGKIKSIDVSTGREKNFAFVVFESNAAVKAVMAEPKIMLNGKQLNVQERTAPGNSSRSYGRTERRPYRMRNSRGNENSGPSSTSSNGPKHGRNKKA